MTLNSLLKSTPAQAIIAICRNGLKPCFTTLMTAGDARNSLLSKTELSNKVKSVEAIDGALCIVVA